MKDEEFEYWKIHGPLTERQIKSIMLKVMTIQVRDYIDKGKITAANYIFDETPDKNGKIESNNYVFGFNSICRFIKIDPHRLKNRIKQLRKDGTRITDINKLF